jgi:ATP synthase protein I
VTDNLATPLRNAALKVVFLQGTLALTSAVLVFVIWGAFAAQSALFGGVVATLPNLVFALYAFRYAGARQAKLVYTSFKRGNGLKFLLTILLFTLVFKFSQVMALPFFACFILVMFANWLAPIFFH